MDKKKTILDSISEYPDTWEVKPEVLDDARKLAQKTYGTQSKKRFVGWRKILVAACIPCVVIAAVLLPFLFRQNPVESKFFSNDELIYTETSVSQWVQEQNVPILYFTLTNAEMYEQQFVLKEDQTLAFFQQNLIVFKTDSFDIVTLYIVQRKDRFEMFGKYESLPSTMTYGDWQIQYGETVSNEIYCTDAAFVINDITYYLSIQSDQEKQLSRYLDSLIP